jgi:hypothetical protein
MGCLHVGDDDGGALGVKLLGDVAADALSAAGDDRHTVPERAHQGISMNGAGLRMRLVWATIIGRSFWT